jgi:thymidylate synthase (FAD)
MSLSVVPRVQLVSSTQYHPVELPDGSLFATDTDDGGSAAAEFGGRACYQSWSKPNPGTATNAGYLDHIKEVGHFSVLEHGTVGLYISGVSRSFTHELIRSRHLSYSQQSQRYVDESGAAMVLPPLLVEIIEGGELDSLVEFEDAASVATSAYERLTDDFLASLDVIAPNLSKTDRRKAARQAARAILPNATETRIMVTGNYRAWRHFIDIRATEHADAEIRAVAVMILRELQKVAPNVFGDYVIAADGTVTSKFVR